MYMDVAIRNEWIPIYYFVLISNTPVATGLLNAHCTPCAMTESHRLHSDSVACTRNPCGKPGKI